MGHLDNAQFQFSENVQADGVPNNRRAAFSVSWLNKIYAIHSIETDEIRDKSMVDMRCRKLVSTPGTNLYFII